MKFWIATFTMSGSNKTYKTIIRTPDYLEKTKIKKDVLSVHPEYRKISLRKLKRKVKLLFEENS